MPGTNASSGKTPDTYLDMVGQFPLKSLQSDADLDAAQKVIVDLLARDLDEGTEMYLDALTDLIEHYESVHHPIPSASEADMLRYLMEANGLSQVQLATAVNMAPSAVSAVLSGVRALTKAQIIALAQYFRINASAFLPGPLEAPPQGAKPLPRSTHATPMPSRRRRLPQK